MGSVVDSNASLRSILRDVRRTLKTAALRGGSVNDDAVQLLGEAYEGATDLGSRLDELTEDMESARLELIERDEAANDLIRSQKDQLWNLIGRPGRDRIFIQYYPDGATYHTKLKPSSKQRGILMLATVFRTIPHPRIPAEVVEEVTTKLEAAADEVKGAYERLEALRTERRLVQAQRAAAVRYARMQLAHLKRLWIVNGMTEPEIHSIIPDQGRPTSPETPIEEVAAQPDIDLAAAK